MNVRDRLLAACATASVLLAAGCNYVKPVMYIDIANHSGRTMINIEVTHPTGIFGLPELRGEQLHQHMAPIGTPCKFSIAFEDQSGKKYAQNFEIGTKCPTEISFDIGEGMSITERQVRP